MPRSNPPVVALLAAALVAIIAWICWPRAEAAPPGPAGSGAAAPAGHGAATNGDVAANAVDASTAATGGSRVAIDRDDAAQTEGKAILRITTRRAGGAVVANVMVAAHAMRGNRISPAFARGITDEQGLLEFRGVTPGKVYLASERSSQKRVDVLPGLNEVDFEVKPGVDVQGRVLAPDGTPVGDAEVWLQTASSEWHGARVLGRTAEDGTFALAAVPSTCSLGAVARGFAPSTLVDLEVVDQRAPPARVELRLQPGGGELVGRVTDQAGAPIAGAQVAIGDRAKSADYEGGRVIEVWAVRAVETDAAGRYAIPGVPAGPTKVSARAAGFGIWRGEAAIDAGQVTVLDLELERGAVLVGRVTDKYGAPEKEARVSAFDREPKTPFLAGGQIDFDETFGHLEVLADANGNYRLESVTPGPAWLFAQRAADRSEGVSVAWAREQIELPPGGQTRWDPVIDVGRSVAGVVRYRDGHPIPNLFVTLRDERAGQEHVVNSGRNGTFRFLCLADSTFEVRVQPPFDAPKGHDAPRRTGVVPDQGSVEITVDYDKPAKENPGTISGRVADVGARIRNQAAATVTIHSDARWFRPGIKVEGGAFRVADVTPGRFRVILKEGETVLASTDWYELSAGGTVDVGVLTTEPGGALRIRAARGRGTENFEPKLYLKRDGDASSTTVALGRADEALAESLTPGSYEVTAYHKGMVGVKAAATVTAGQTADLLVALQAGASGKIAVWWPENHAGSKTRGYRVTNAEGKTMHEHEGPMYTASLRPHDLHYTLPAGGYRVEFWTDDGLRGNLDFAIPPSLEPVTPRLDLK